MPLPKRTYRGQSATISMTELRKRPGEVIDRVSHGMTIHVDKNGKRVASIVPSESLGEEVDCVIHRDGSITGRLPLTLGVDLGNGGY
jgi:prevent-host-death family protein